MKIGILGSGEVGRKLGSSFLATGHQVMIGSRDAANAKAATWVKETGADASSGAFADAAKFGEVLVLATLWSGTENAIQLAGKDNFAGKVLIDATNPLKFDGSGPPELSIGHSDSGGETVQRWLPAARVVKAFNSVGFAYFFKPAFADGPPDMFICGNDDAAKKIVTDVLTSFGWATIDIGPIEGARLLEPLCMLWVGYGFRTNTWHHAFKLLRD